MSWSIPLVCRLKAEGLRKCMVCDYGVLRSVMFMEQMKLLINAAVRGVVGRTAGVWMQVANKENCLVGAEKFSERQKAQIRL